MFVEYVDALDGKEVDQDVMDLDIDETRIEVKRRTRSREPRQSDMVQIFVKMDGLKTFPLMVSPSDKVDDVMKRIRNNEVSSKSDVYMLCEGRVLRW